MKKNVVYLMLAFLVISGCNALPENSILKKMRANDFLVVSDLGSSLYVSETYLNRDFMPLISSNPDAHKGRGLTGSITCKRIDGGDVSTKIKVVKIVLKHLEETWETSNLETELYEPEPDRINFRFRDGPLWSPAASVDLNLTYIDLDGVEYTIVINNQHIHRSM